MGRCLGKTLLSEEGEKKTVCNWSSKSQILHLEQGSPTFYTLRTGENIFVDQLGISGVLEVWSVQSWIIIIIIILNLHEINKIMIHQAVDVADNFNNFILKFWTFYAYMAILCVD